MTTPDIGLALTLGGAAMLLLGEIGRRAPVRTIGLIGMLTGCALTLADILRGGVTGGP